MQGMGENTFNLNLIEYGTLAEDTDPNAEIVKVIVPKISGTVGSPDQEQQGQADKTKFINSQNSTINASDNTTKSGVVKARVVHSGAHRHSFHDCWPASKNCPNLTHEACTCHKGTSTLKECRHFHHDHHMPHERDFGLVPKGTKVMVLFMDYDPNDAWLLRWCFDFPDGVPQPDRPYDMR